MSRNYDRAVFCTADTHSKAIAIAELMRSSGFPDSDISLIAPEASVRSGVGVQVGSKAAEGAATGGGTGLLLGGALGWMAGIGALAIPGLGPFIAAGPIMAALGGAAAGTAVGGLTGGLVGLGFTEYEAKQYQSFLNEGHSLISVTVSNDDEEARAREILDNAGADNISVKSIVADAPNRPR